MVKLDFSSYMKNFSNTSNYESRIKEIEYRLKNDKEMLDWYTIDKCISKEELNKVIEISKDVKQNCDVFIVVSIGGSFVGAKAIIDALSPYFNNHKPEIIFVGNSLSSFYLKELIDYIKDKEVTINVISKSGTTFETMIWFECLYKEMQQKYDEEELQKRIIITTDKNAGYLRELVDEKNYQSLEVPSQIGGRYSVLTAVGLLPMAVSGIDINKLLQGARESDIKEAFQYAVIRDMLYQEGKIVESFTLYEPKLLYFGEWLKQLFGETQGKNNQGILPIISINTRDLHSLGQFFQEGNKVLFETVINIENSTNFYIEKFNRQLDEINNIVAHKVASAHYETEMYSNFISIDKLDEYNLGYLIYFFEVAAATGGYLLKVNPFNQPGVQAYKTLVSEELER